MFGRRRWWTFYRYYRSDGSRLYRGKTSREFWERDAEHRAESVWYVDVDHSRTEHDRQFVTDRQARLIEKNMIQEATGTLANSQHNGMRGQSYESGDKRWADPQPFDLLFEVVWAYGWIVPTVGVVLIVAACTVLAVR